MRPVIIFLSIFLSLNWASCNPAGENEIPLPGNNGTGTGGENPNDNMRIRITIGTTVFTAAIEDSAAGRAFVKLLPLSLNMADVNSNEKYARLGQSLPVSASPAGTIRTGDLMLWGSDGLVLFYKTFPSSYSYTRLGALVDASNLESVAGNGSVRVTFELTGD